MDTVPRMVENATKGRFKAMRWGIFALVEFRSMGCGHIHLDETGDDLHVCDRFLSFVAIPAYVAFRNFDSVTTQPQISSAI